MLDLQNYQLIILQTFQWLFNATTDMSELDSSMHEPQLTDVVLPVLKQSEDVSDVKINPDLTYTQLCDISTML